MGHQQARNQKFRYTIRAGEQERCWRNRKRRRLARPDSWGQRAEAHWKKHRPKTYKGLKADGELFEVLAGVGRAAELMHSQLVEKGVPEIQANEIVMSEFILLPD